MSHTTRTTRTNAPKFTPYDEMAGAYQIFKSSLKRFLTKISFRLAYLKFWQNYDKDRKGTGCLANLAHNYPSLAKGPLTRRWSPWSSCRTSRCQTGRLSALARLSRVDDVRWFCPLNPSWSRQSGGVVWDSGKLYCSGPSTDWEDP